MVFSKVVRSIITSYDFGVLFAAGYTGEPRPARNFMSGTP